MCSSLLRASVLLLASALGACLMEDGSPDRPTLISAAAPGLLTDAAVLDASPGSSDKAKPSHLPCAVEALIRMRCAGCHSPSTLPHRPISLLSYEELLQPSASVPGQSYAQQAEQLLASGMMPPTAALPAAEVQVFASWVRAGAPPGECNLDAGAADAGDVRDAQAEPIDSGAHDAWAADAADAALAPDTGRDDDAGGARCSSGSYWRGGETRSPLMHPGRACIACHTAGTGFLSLQHGPSFGAAGTLYPSAHEPDDCNGASTSGVSVVIVGSGAQRLTLTPNSVGNFTTLTRIALPFHAEIQYQGRSRATLTAHQNGDCNGCHSQTGAQGAAGRLSLP